MYVCVFSAQPEICRWNIEKLGEAVRWAVPESVTREALEAYDAEYDRCVTHTHTHIHTHVDAHVTHGLSCRYQSPQQH